ncbi:MAG TPA: ABC transporter permease [Acidimicrobiia bacterium]|nr:ABC transporter permease [Acidimicrobiia bacterium]
MTISDGPVVEAAEETPVREAGLWSDAWRQLRRNPLFVGPAVLIALFTVMAVAPGLFTRTDPRACDLSHSLLRPSARHWFGYDLQGCDYYAKVIHGARVSMTIGISTVLGTALVAVVLGTLAGFYGGIVDTLIARVTDVWFALPTFLGAVVVLSVLGGNGLAQLTLVLVLFGWPTMTRLMRSSVLSVRDMEYVTAARALGAGDLRLMVRHVLPNALAPVVVYGAIRVGIVIAAEATLSFLGLGLQLPAISWGLMIASAQPRLLTAPHLLLFPGLFLSLTVLAFVLLGDALRDAFDPRLR